MKRKRFEKTPIDPQRLRRIPDSGFSWIDRRFVREGFLEELPREAILLYFFLVAVSDAKGMSFYADPTTSRMLKLTPEELCQSRYRLRGADLILYRDPLYQVLPLPPCGEARRNESPPPPSRRGGEAKSIGDILADYRERRRNERL